MAMNTNIRDDDEYKAVVFWLSSYHASYQNFDNEEEAELFRARLQAISEAGKLWRGRSIYHVTLSLRNNNAQ